jgi:hypothetical protein
MSRSFKITENSEWVNRFIDGKQIIKKELFFDVHCHIDSVNRWGQDNSSNHIIMECLSREELDNLINSLKKKNIEIVD